MHINLDSKTIQRTNKMCYNDIGCMHDLCTMLCTQCTYDHMMCWRCSSHADDCSRQLSTSDPNVVCNVAHTCNNAFNTFDCRGNGEWLHYFFKEQQTLSYSCKHCYSMCLDQMCCSSSKLSFTVHGGIARHQTCDAALETASINKHKLRGPFVLKKPKHVLLSALRSRRQPFWVWSYLLCLHSLPTKFSWKMFVLRLHSVHL